MDFLAPIWESKISKFKTYLQNLFFVFSHFSTKTVFQLAYFTMIVKLICKKNNILYFFKTMDGIF